MAKQRVNLSDLANEPVLEARLPQFAEAQRTTAPVDIVAPNPLNPRESLGDLSELAESMKLVGQLQPATVVTRNAYLAQYPEHEATIGTARYIAVTGGRRRAAAALAGMATLEITVKDSLAQSRETLAVAAIAENIERQDLTPLDEARAVQMLVRLCGSGQEAAVRLSRSGGWVSQRLALLKLSDEMKALLRSGDLPVRDARRLANLEQDQQLVTWQTEQEDSGFTAVKPESETIGEADGAKPTPASRTAPALSAIRKLGGTPPRLAENLLQYLSHDDLKALVELLSAEL